jgi:hypothetical protein
MADPTLPRSALPQTPPQTPQRKAAGGRRDDERVHELERLAWLGRQLDTRWRLPGTSIRIGADGLVGLIPGIGDTLAALPSAYMIVRGWQLGARRRTVAKMAVNTGVDYVLGTIPLVGDIFDIGFKGNLRNIRLLEDEFGHALHRTPAAPGA